MSRSTGKAAAAPDRTCTGPALRLRGFLLTTLSVVVLALGACGGGGGNTPAAGPAPETTGAAKLSLPRLSATTPGDPFARLRQAHPLAQKRTTPPAAEVATPNGAPSLPPIDVLSRQVSAPTLQYLYGAEYDPALPNARLLPSDGLGTFVPVGPGLKQAALGIYHFELPGYDGPHGVELLWDTAPPAGTCFLAVADYSSKQWKWFAVDGNTPLSFEDSVDFVSPGGQIYVAVICVGTALSKLTSVTFGEDAPPVAIPIALYKFMQPGKNYFSGQHSTDDFGITALEWDLDNNGSFEIVDDGLTSIEADFLTAGTHTVKLRVTDSAGQTSIASYDFVVDSPGYDEVEPNNLGTQANDLPLSAQGWEGNLGSGGYDGGNTDYYHIQVVEPLRLEFHLTSTVSDAFAMALYNSDLSQILFYGTQEMSSSDMFCGVVQPGDYILSCDCASAVNADYKLDALGDYFLDYDEVEDNDQAADADLFIPEFPFYGNLGQAGYDGDRGDFWNFEVVDPDSVYSISLLFDPSKVDIDMELLDGMGTTLATSAGSQDEEINFLFPAPGIYVVHAYVYANAPQEQMGDYRLRALFKGFGPHSDLQVTPASGSAPQTITLDASASTAATGHTIAYYLWDTNGDSTLDAQTTEAVITRKIYKTGPATPTVYVVQDDSLYGSAQDTVDFTGTVFETESNNTLATANELGTFPFFDKLAVIGPSMDEFSDVDIYHFSAVAGPTYAFYVDTDKDVLYTGAAIYDSSGTELDIDDNVDGSIIVSQVFPSAGDYYVIVLSNAAESGYAGYKLTGTAE